MPLPEKKSKIFGKTFVNRNENVVTLQTETETTPFPLPFPHEGARGRKAKGNTVPPSLQNRFKSVSYIEDITVTRK